MNLKIRTRFGIFIASIICIVGALVISACGDNPTTEACLIAGDPECGNNLVAVVADSGTDSDGGTDGNSCTTNPNFGKVCVDMFGHLGHFVCLGNVLTCTPDNNVDGGGAMVDGSIVYRCSTDPLKGTFCDVGPPKSVCANTGLFQCQHTEADAPTCNVSPRAPNPLGEICGNGLDDDCDGNVDEVPCTNGSGGVDGGVITDGGATCTTATTITATVLAPTSLTSLLKGAGSTDTSDPLIRALVNNDLLALNASGGISVSVNNGMVNVFRANSPGGDPTPLLDALFCRQLGINPPSPSSCNSGVIGSRTSASYLSALNADFTCWRTPSACASTIAGYIPGDLFSLMKVVQNGDSLSQSPFTDSYAGAPHFVLIEDPRICP